MKTKLALAVAVMLSAVAMSSQAACMRCGPIQNITEASVPSPGGKSLSRDDVKKAIMRAGGTLGWKMDDNAPGKITGTLSVRTHTAVIEIPYSPKSYSINYKSSVNLEDKGDGTIHNNYNGWVKNLAKGIDAQLAAH